MNYPYWVIEKDPDEVAEMRKSDDPVRKELAEKVWDKILWGMDNMETDKISHMARVGKRDTKAEKFWTDWVRTSGPRSRRRSRF